MQVAMRYHQMHDCRPFPPPTFRSRSGWWWLTEWEFWVLFYAPCAFLLCHTLVLLWRHFYSYSQGFCLIFVCVLTGWALRAQEDILLASNSGIWTPTCRLPKSYSVPGLDLLKAYKIFWEFLCKIHMSICKLLSCPPRFDTAQPRGTGLASRPGPNIFHNSQRYGYSSYSRKS